MSPTMIAVYVFVLSCFVGYHVIWGVTQRITRNRPCCARS